MEKMNLKDLIDWAKRVEKLVQPFNIPQDIEIAIQSGSEGSFIVAIWENERFEIYPNKK